MSHDYETGRDNKFSGSNRTSLYLRVMEIKASKLTISHKCVHFKDLSVTHKFR